MPIPKSRTPPRTKQAFVFQTLRHAILRCELQPGERLVIEELARRLAVSPIPVREALQQLQSEGLVEVVPHVGATVASLSRASVVDIFTILEGLQIVAARHLARHASDAELDTLDAMVSEMEAVLARGDLETWAELNTQFHVAIGTLPGLPLLRQMTEQAFDRWNRVRRHYFSDVLALRMPQAQQEHHAIVAAMRARDVEQLSLLMRHHSQSALAAYEEYLDRHVDTEAVNEAAPGLETGDESRA